MKKLAALLDAIVVEPAPTAPPHLALDRGYDYDALPRRRRSRRGYTPHIPPKASAARAAAAAGRTPTATRRGAGWWRWRTAGSTASAGC